LDDVFCPLPVSAVTAKSSRSRIRCEFQLLQSPAPLLIFVAATRHEGLFQPGSETCADAPFVELLAVSESINALAGGGRPAALGPAVDWAVIETAGVRQIKHRGFIPAASRLHLCVRSASNQEGIASPAPKTPKVAAKKSKRNHNGKLCLREGNSMGVQPADTPVNFP
jgi:hypothetical protein